MGEQMTTSRMARLIDHTLLRADANESELASHCREAIECGFFSVCVNPIWIKFCAQQLKNTSVVVCTVVGFPLGANTTASKAGMTSEAIELGASEIDMVIHLGALKSQQWKVVEEDIAAVVRAAHGRAVKVILETALLNDDEKRLACKAAESAGAAFVKTSTGFGPGGATVADVRLLKSSVSPNVKVKASGGIRNLGTLKAMIEAGADRIGASAGKKLFSNDAGAGTY